MPPKKAPFLEAPKELKPNNPTKTKNTNNTTVVELIDDDSPSDLTHSQKNNLNQSKASVFTTKRQLIVDFINYETKRMAKNHDSLIQSESLQKQIKIISECPKCTLARKLMYRGLI
ncbi:hypothetical protein TVAG_158770 [Trichomonas vaginalis G3]|uniref:Uncharacterized protein n=1 Tax=Trichomonas vaginalis (strain ATCC PRA-98 / G3) TaxID=412133 RepID=A2E6Q6_TRIV3|nr:hypothetical protein TVAGG3_0779430 [Trichomonas vaginalis G3]EAY11650.1 hypothetical protein TVAG_158770 [Trichomonas vaginalis G3]KAI5494945.1 hypothetical protein TVAGG3_0779430 [Trichomonas vaginalis G3]|eukprot:XP_001323873.1 hypothetical protein [Trichomonas vaginalis G3]